MVIRGEEEVIVIVNVRRVFLWSCNWITPQLKDLMLRRYLVSNTKDEKDCMNMISNFTQHSVSHTGDAITTFNGTFSVSMREGIVNDVSGYIQFTGDLVSIWLDPTILENHFGPTPIQGMVLPQTEGDESTEGH